MNRLIMTFVLVLSLAVNVFSQAQMSSGDIKGTVADPSGAVMANVGITVTNVDTGVERAGSTDALGNFRFLVLPPGSYEVRVQAGGFATYTRRPVQVTVGQSVVIDPQMQPAAIQQEILVQESAPVLELEKTQQSDTITEDRIDNLPINKRSFLDFSLLTPGVTDAKALVSFTLPQTPTSGLSFLGQNGRSNSVSIDGVDNNDNAVAAVRSTISQEAVQEFQINRSNYSAEFGRASGGLINIVSKSGTNAWNGNVFSFLRDQSLDARNPFAFGSFGAPTDPEFSRLQAGFTLGGPIKRDKTFMFLSYEGLRQRESNFVSFLENDRFFQPTASQRTLLTALSASPNAPFRTLGGQLGAALTTSAQTFPNTVRLLQSNSGVFPFRNNDNTASLRLDHNLSASNQMFGRLSFTDIDTVGGAFGGLKGPSRGANYQIQDYAAVFGDTHLFSSRLVNEFRFQYANRDYNALAADPLGPEITINGVASLGRDFFLPSTRNEKRFQFVDNMTFVAGKHELKFGGDFHAIPFNTVTEVFLGGRFIFGEAIPLGLIIDNFTGQGNAAALATAFALQGRLDVAQAIGAPITSLQSFNFGLPIVYQQGFGNPRADLKNYMYSAYVQDSFKVARNFTLNLGLRYDSELQPKPVHRDKNNLGPRFGFSYSPETRTVIRGGYGIYYSPLFEAIAFVERVLDGKQISQVFLPLTGLPAFGINATSAQVWGLASQRGILGNRSITAADIAPLGIQAGVTPSVLLKANPGINNPYSQQFSLGVEREVAGDFTVGLNYIANKGVGVLRSRNTNLRQVGANAYGPTFGPINPRVLQDNYVESSGSSIYHGFAMSALKRYGDNSQLQVSYTLSKTIDDTTDFITDLQPANQLDLRNERSLSAFDQRQRLVVSSVLTSPFDRGAGIGQVLADVTVSPIFTYGSGHPFNLLLGFDANGDTQANTDRPAYAGRNTGKGPDFVSFDLRLAKTFRIGDGGTQLEGIFEAFNLFNRVNFSGVNNIVGSTPMTNYRVEGRRDVGPAEPLGFTSASDPRQIQLGVKLRF